MSPEGEWAVSRSRMYRHPALCPHSVYGRAIFAMGWAFRSHRPSQRIKNPVAAVLRPGPRRLLPFTCFICFLASVARCLLLLLLSLASVTLFSLREASLLHQCFPGDIFANSRRTGYWTEVQCRLEFDRLDRFERLPQSKPNRSVRRLPLSTATASVPTRTRRA